MPFSKYSLSLYLFQFPSISDRDAVPLPFFFAGMVASDTGPLNFVFFFRSNVVSSCHFNSLSLLLFSAVMLLARDSNPLSLLLFSAAIVGSRKPPELLESATFSRRWVSPFSHLPKLQVIPNFPDFLEHLDCILSRRQTYNFYFKLQSHAWVFSSMHHECLRAVRISKEFQSPAVVKTISTPVPCTTS